MLAGTGFVFVGETIVFVCAGNWKTTYPRKSGKNLQLDRRPQSLEGAAGNCTDKLLVFDVLEPVMAGPGHNAIVLVILNFMSLLYSLHCNQRFNYAF